MLLLKQDTEFITQKKRWFLPSSILYNRQSITRDRHTYTKWYEFINKRLIAINMSTTVALEQASNIDMGYCVHYLQVYLTSLEVWFVKKTLNCSTTYCCTRQKPALLVFSNEYQHSHWGSSLSKNIRKRLNLKLKRCNSFIKLRLQHILSYYVKISQ